MCVSQPRAIREEETEEGKMPQTVLLQMQRHSPFQDLLSQSLCMWEAPWSKTNTSKSPVPSHNQTRLKSCSNPTV